MPGTNDAAAVAARVIAGAEWLDPLARHRLLGALAAELRCVEPHDFRLDAFVAAYREQMRRAGCPSVREQRLSGEPRGATTSASGSSDPSGAPNRRPGGAARPAQSAEEVVAAAECAALLEDPREAVREALRALAGLVRMDGVGATTAVFALTPAATSHLLAAAVGLLRRAAEEAPAVIGRADREPRFVAHTDDPPQERPLRAGSPPRGHRGQGGE